MWLELRNKDDCLCLTRLWFKLHWVICFEEYHFDELILAHFVINNHISRFALSVIELSFPVELHQNNFSVAFILFKPSYIILFVWVYLNKRNTQCFQFTRYVLDLIINMLSNTWAALKRISWTKTRNYKKKVLYFNKVCLVSMLSHHSLLSGSECITTGLCHASVYFPAVIQGSTVKIYMHGGWISVTSLSTHLEQQTCQEKEQSKT